MHPRGEFRAESAHDRCPVELVRIEPRVATTQPFPLEPEYRRRQRLDLRELLRRRHRAPSGELHRTGSSGSVDGERGAHTRNLRPTDAARHRRGVSSTARLAGRVVVDTNVFLSGVFFGGVPGRILEAWQAGHLTLVLSPAILAEYHRAGAALAARYARIEARSIPS